jgi:quinol monooxygenase YgiN
MDHAGTVWFAVGSLAEEVKRDVNDRDFDVALHLVFKNKAAYDQYSQSERHQTFIKENKDNWKRVREFDSNVFYAKRDPGRF